MPLLNYITILVFLFVGESVQASWRLLEPGLELGEFSITAADQLVDRKIHILRIDPKSWALDMLSVGQAGQPLAKTARQWALDNDYVAVINAGMYATDLKTHVGYMASSEHANNTHVSGYKSVVAFNPKQGRQISPFRIFDLETPDVDIKVAQRDYQSIVQNLRLIKKPGINRWLNPGRLWSEAALGEDKFGNILFIFSKSPFSMHQLNEELLALNIDLVAAQHLEGGTKAQMFVLTDNIELNLVGESLSPLKQFSGIVAPPIPNIFGIRRIK